MVSGGHLDPTGISGGTEKGHNLIWVVRWFRAGVMCQSYMHMESHLWTFMSDARGKTACSSLDVGAYVR